MNAASKRNLSLIVGRKKRRMIHIDCLVDEQSDILITDLAVMTGKDPSLLMNEAIGELIRRYRPKARDMKRTLKLIKC